MTGREIKKDIKLIALDLDGTTFNSQKEITPHTCEVISNIIEKGVVVVPATGRPKALIPEQLFNIEGIRYILTSNGASITDLKTEKPVYEALMEIEHLSETVDILKTKNLHLEFFYDGNVYCDESAKASSKKILEKYPNLKMMMGRTIFLKDLYQRFHKDPFPIEKLNLFFEDPEVKKQVIEEFRWKDWWDITSAVPENLEIVSKEAQKGKTLLKLADLLGIKQEETMAIGDSGNDLNMLSAVGTAVAMGNALPEVKEISDFITKSNDEDGVAYAIQTMVSRD